MRSPNGQFWQAHRAGEPLSGGVGYHAKNEYIEIDSIVPRIYLTSRILQDLARSPAK
jgi:hypothetical protein